MQMRMFYPLCLIAIAVASQLLKKKIRTEERRCHGALSPHKGWMSRKKWPATMYQYCIML